LKKKTQRQHDMTCIFETPPHQIRVWMTVHYFSVTGLCSYLTWPTSAQNVSAWWKQDYYDRNTNTETFKSQVSQKMDDRLGVSLVITDVESEMRLLQTRKVIHIVNR
jgi:hypothetical protein